MAKETTSIRMTEADRATFTAAMEAEGIDALATWIVRAARLRAREVIEGKADSETANAIRDLEATFRTTITSLQERIHELEYCRR